MKKGKIGFSHLISAVLIIILIVSVLWFFTPIFNEIKAKMGFVVDLTPGQIEAQTKALGNFDNFKVVLNDCIASSDLGCFCTNESIVFPTNYYLIFKEKGTKTEVTLYNEYDSLLNSDSFHVNPCIGSGFIMGSNLHYFNNILIENMLTIIYGSPSTLVYTNIQGGIEETISEDEIDISHTFFKPKSDTLCILSLERATMYLSNEKLCSKN